MKAFKPLEAIRAKCIDCCAGSRSEVRLCEIDDCALHPFRMGYNPNKKGLGKRENLRLPDRAGISDYPQPAIIEKPPTHGSITSVEPIPGEV